MSVNFSALADRVGINTLVGLLNREETNIDGSSSIDAYRINEYYSKMALDKIAISQENYVFLKYARTFSIPKGHANWTIRKKFGLTEHTIPLLEGIPPKSDMIRKDKISGTFHQYGRYMEVSDRVDFALLDPILMEYAQEYGDVAVRTLHRLARKELLNSTFVNYANNKTSKGELVVGDYVGLADFRLAALKMNRLAVRPIGGTFKVITSEEHYWDLMKDPLIMEYIGQNNGLEHYKTGILPDLFNISFEKTQLDDFAYGYELGNPGEYEDTNGAIKCRVYMVLEDNYIYANADSSYRTVYISEEYADQSPFLTAKSRLLEEIPTAVNPASGYNADGTPSGYTTADAVGTYEAASESNNRLADGSWVPIRAVWSVDYKAFLGPDMDSGLSADVSDKTAWGSFFYTYVNSTKTFTIYILDSNSESESYIALGTVITADGKLNKANIAATIAQLETDETKGTWNPGTYVVKQLPIHTAIMLGEEALARLEIEGEGNVQVFAKPKGSAGVLDPIDQRQSIGIKINTVGFKRIREEAVWLFHHVPTQATATAGISL